MAGIKFPFKEIVPLLTLSIGLARRIDENRAESLAVLYCNFGNFKQELITASLEQILRSCDAMVNYENHYFFILQYTDRYGATIVKDMFEEFFASTIQSYTTCYPIDGEDALTLLEDIQATVSKDLSLDLLFLDEERLIN